MSSSEAALEPGGPDVFSQQYAEDKDATDPLRHLRDEFIIPTKADLKRATIDKCESEPESEESIYLCGNSLGLQPRLTSVYVAKHLSTWATKGVFGHFKEHSDSVAPPWLHIADFDAKTESATLVGAKPDEVAVMQTLTANLHFLLASFYRPTKERWKIIIEGKAFPSDHYAALSQLHHHSLPPSALICITPPANPSNSPYLPTSHILSVIEAHASSTAVLLLPGIQYYSGQLLDVAAITAFARARGVAVGWDLAHAAGNVPLRLHDWGVDFAAWCSYKYLNAGPGAMAGLFVHERHGAVDPRRALGYTPRLSGWWGHDKGSRFDMGPAFVPIAGAAGWQVSNPSALDASAVLASLAVFGKTSMDALREKSVRLTGYLEFLLTHRVGGTGNVENEPEPPYEIITPRNPAERGAQLSVRLKEGLLDVVMEILEAEGVVTDERRPDVIRVAPAPLYNTYVDVWRFVKVFKEACRKAKADQNAEKLLKSSQ
ncbi:kynureninase 1 (L-kynurenine hydrolase 1)(Biosynthesis of nicotinic acid protein 5-1) [Lineolata rhizophorae]|uniref:Kynureninase n=1 Tax=Lineolata rhizophorae TaxID=578093 RepID=A0A6A6NPH5_9PEZI|nr:kynureninase 1 (L-kynurenine hydrolase 1)(Biosynthesis of nicotinic acid protein 5-1) [Lineolata rhizophorae]